MAEMDQLDGPVTQVYLHSLVERQARIAYFRALHVLFRKAESRCILERGFCVRFPRPFISCLCDDGRPELLKLAVSERMIEVHVGVDDVLDRLVRDRPYVLDEL